MKLLAIIFTSFVAVTHVGILILEMFFWNTPFVNNIFLLTAEFAATTTVLAMNQGLYNGFLAAGLFWGLLANKADVKIFFLGCVIVAGLFGALTVKPGILFTQATPAIIAMVFVVLNMRKTQS